MEAGNTMEEKTEEIGDTVDRWIGKTSLWGSLLLALLVTGWYFQNTPPDTLEVQKMRLYFKENSGTLITFIKMGFEEKEKFAAQQKHPFYNSYMKASEVEKSDINALIHVSTDYTTNQYWFNLIFLWTIFFTTFWFLGLIVQGIINLMRSNPIAK